MTKLSKFLAQSGFCSRRAATELIKTGAVKVNGVTVTQPYHELLEDDSVKVNNKKIVPQKKLYFLFHKPKDLLCTLSDPQDRNTIAHVFKHVPERLYPIGRLDRNTTGLVIMTNDGDLAQKLSHPKFNIAKVYHVTTHRAITAEDMQMLKDGIKLEDGFMKVDDVQYASAHSPKTVIVTIHSGRNHIIKRLFEALRCFVKKLDRSGVAGLTKKGLTLGSYRTLMPKEVERLKSL